MLERYDRKTGQVYVETTAPAVRSMVTTWTSTVSGKKRNPKMYRNSRIGSASLYDSAFRSCVWNIDLFMPEALRYYGWTFAEKIYKHLKETDNLSLTAWTIFRRAFPKEVHCDFHINVPERRGAHPHLISSFTSRISSFYFACLTFLCIRNLRLTKDNLMELTNISNLAVLVLEQESDGIYGNCDSDIDGRFIKTWGRAVHEKKAFKELKVLSLKNFTAGLLDFLQGVTAFPALFICNFDSWYARKDIEEFIRDERVFNNGRWRQMLTNGTRNDGHNGNPEITWWRRDITIHRKMQIFYDLAASHLQQPSIKKARQAAMSIDYGDSKSLRYSMSYSSWFVRILPSKTELTQPPKRAQDIGVGNGPCVATENKKRKVRQLKRADLGLVLGSLGH
ncbi:hypothetical protein CC78DRAFT_161966 [Lojkania enalia]|uniref:Uncharacterized protein n=1 Tax=Lojkania enalia TaxID=147567 RepID=A0A9P4KEI6_9PLEO|nr:hypothetical protein CC78DRAFT_161966 [Didymosphaeria enalia]